MRNKATSFEARAEEAGKNWFARFKGTTNPSGLRFATDEVLTVVDFRAGAQWAMRWIPVTERLPDRDGQYLTWFHALGQAQPALLFFRGGEWCCENLTLTEIAKRLGTKPEYVSHWREIGPLPEE